MNLTETLAIWGALLSSITFGWNLLRDLHDRPKVKVYAAIGKVLEGEGGSGLYFVKHTALESHGDAVTSGKMIVKVEVTNIGRRPVCIDGFGGKYRRSQQQTPSKKSGFVIVPRALPKMLNEGQSHTEIADEPLKVLGDDVRAIMAWDSTGKNWYLSRKQLRSLREEAKKLKAEGKL
jgi:hypothetical protein